MSDGRKKDNNGSVKSPVEPCPMSCIDLEYLRADGTGVASAKYVVYSVDAAGNKDGAYEKRGSLDDLGRARIDHVPDISRFNYYFEQDPQNFEIKKDKQPVEKPDEHEATSYLDGVGNWIWGTIQGDFNKDQTISQIAVNAILGLIPLVDQALDVRDIIAGVKDIIDYYSETEEKQEKHEDALGLDYETWIWINVFIIAIGCIPVVGSAVKGVLKGVLFYLKRLGKKAGSLSPRQLKDAWEYIVSILNHFGVGNANKWLKEFPGKIDGWMDESATKIRGALDALSEMLDSAMKYSKILGSDKSQAILKRIGQYKKAIGKAHNRLDAMKSKVNNWLKEQIEVITKGAHKYEQRGATGTAGNRINNKRVQTEAEAPELPKPQTPTERLAAEGGNTAAHIAARRAVAKDFYKENAKWMNDAQINDHLKGIDFSKPVVSKVSPPPVIVEQWQVPGGPQGNYYAAPGTPANALGIGNDGIVNTPYGPSVSPKVTTNYEVPPGTPYLESTSSPVTDTWSIPAGAVNDVGVPQNASGGGIQLFIPKKPQKK
jgi:hypothetical protein